MHKLVYTWGHDRLEVEEQRSLSGLALELMADATAEKSTPANKSGWCRIRWPALERALSYTKRGVRLHRTY